MDWMNLAEKFGLPGLMLCAFGYVFKVLGTLWISSNERIQMERIKVEDKKADAHTAALVSLGGKVDAHHTADIQSHQDLGEGIADIKATLAERRGNTPIEGVPLTPASGYYGPSRPKTSGGR